MHCQASRRDVLQAGSLGLFGLSLPQLLAGRALAEPTGRPPAKSCILLFMWGGPAHQDTWDLKPAAPVEIRGEFQPIATATPGIQICEHFPRLAKQTERLAIIRSMTHDNVDHTKATHYLLTGQKPPISTDPRKDWPSMGAVLSKLGYGQPPLPPFIQMRPKLDNDVPRFVEQSQGQFAGWLGPNYDPLTIDANPADQRYRVGDFEKLDGINSARLHHRQSLLSGLDRDWGQLDRDVKFRVMADHYSRAFDLLDSAQAQGAFDLGQEPAEIREKYGRNPHGQSVLQARRLIERGVSLVTVFWPSDGIKNVSILWDTHSRNFVDLKDRLMPPADQAFSALLDDLAERGLLDETLVVWTGEFGRTPRVGQRNSDAGAGRDGRDHWPGCFTSVLAGGGVRGGQVYGSSDRQAAYPASNPVAPLDLAATIYQQMGVPLDLELHDEQGRPMANCAGNPVSSLVS
ncbi:MAG: DUF1501 domain-containing protein [Planctomycetaceae bacterium]